MYRPPLSEIVIRIKHRLSGGYGIPRPRYVTAVAGGPDVRHFLESGHDSAAAIKEMLRRNGVEPRTLADGLEFGCGVGRILRHWGNDSPRRLHGTDYNPRLIAWSRRHYPFATFSVNPLEGPLPYADASFDLVYTWSVFTHLDDDLCRYWIAELARVIRPGGLLFATFHGEFYVPELTPAEQRAFNAGELVVRRGAASGSNECATFHPRAAVDRLVAARFAVADSAPGTMPFRAQTQYLLRKHR